MRVLVLSRSTGEGHNHAALAVGEAFVRHGHDAEVLDAFGVVDADKRALYAVRPAAAASPASSGRALLPLAAEPVPARRHRVVDVASALYGWAALNAPPTFGIAYALGEIYTRTPVPSPIKIVNSRYAEATHAFIEEREYDAIVCTHLFPMATLTAIRARHTSRVRTYGVLTDYACIPFLSETRLDGHFIPHADIVDDCVRHGLPRAALWPLGLPVSAAFGAHLPRASARARLGLPQEGPVFLLMSGGVGSQHLRTLCEQLLNSGDAATHIVVLTGRREELFRQIAGRYRDDPRVHVVPFTDRVPEYMAAADVVVSKPGGVSSTEAAVAGAPLVHTGAIPGIETKNARFFAARGLSAYSPNIGEAAVLARWLRHDEAAQARMRAAQASTVAPDAADAIVAHVEDDLA